MVRSHRERPWTWRVGHRGRSCGRFPAYLAGCGARRFPRFPVRRRAAAGAAGKLLHRARATYMSSRRGPDGTREERRSGAEAAVTSPIACGSATGSHFPLSALGQRDSDRDLPGDMPGSQDQGVLRQQHRSCRDKRRPALYRPRQCLRLPRSTSSPDCTCNGRDAFGLARSRRQAIRRCGAGDIVATKDGLQAYTGRRGQGAAFSPVDDDGGHCRARRATSHTVTARRPARRPPRSAESIARPDADRQADTTR